MVRIRLRRVGAKGQPSYRLVAADKESPRDGRFLENLGFYNPRTHPATIQLKEDRIYEWLSKGAQPSDSAFQVLKSAGHNYFWFAGLLDRKPENSFLVPEAFFSTRKKPLDRQANLR